MDGIEVVRAPGVDGSEHVLVLEHDAPQQPIDVDRPLGAQAGDPLQDRDAVRAEDLDARDRERGEARRLDDEIERSEGSELAELAADVGERRIERGDVGRAEGPHVGGPLPV